MIDIAACDVRGLRDIKSAPGEEQNAVTSATNATERPRLRQKPPTNGENATAQGRCQGQRPRGRCATYRLPIAGSHRMPVEADVRTASLSVSSERNRRGYHPTQMNIRRASPQLTHPCRGRDGMLRLRRSADRMPHRRCREDPLREWMDRLEMRHKNGTVGEIDRIRSATAATVIGLRVDVALTSHGPARNVPESPAAMVTAAQPQ
jgi:hypothetical protein